MRGRQPGLGMLAFGDWTVLVSPFSILASKLRSRRGGIRCASYSFTGRRVASLAKMLQ